MATVKTINQYRKYNQFEPPYKVFLDQKFIEYMIRFKKTVQDISHLLGDEARLFTTSCVKKDISMLQWILELMSTQRFLLSITDIPCCHDSADRLPSQDCITRMFSNGNRSHYFVATINKFLETMFLKMRTVPVIGLRGEHMILRKPVASPKKPPVVESSWDKPVVFSDIEKKLSDKDLLKKLLTPDNDYICEPSAEKKKKQGKANHRKRVRESLRRESNGKTRAVCSTSKRKPMEASKEGESSKPIGDARLRGKKRNHQEPKEANDASKGESSKPIGDAWLRGQKRNHLEPKESDDALKRERSKRIVDAWLSGKRRNLKSYINDDDDNMSKETKLEICKNDDEEKWSISKRRELQLMEAGESSNRVVDAQFSGKKRNLEICKNDDEAKRSMSKRRKPGKKRA